MCHWAKQGRPALVHAICSRFCLNSIIFAKICKKIIFRKKVVLYLQRQCFICKNRIIFAKKVLHCIIKAVLYLERQHHICNDGIILERYYICRYCTILNYIVISLHSNIAIHDFQDDVVYFCGHFMQNSVWRTVNFASWKY